MKVSLEAFGSNKEQAYHNVNIKYQNVNISAFVYFFF